MFAATSLYMFSQITAFKSGNTQVAY